MKSQLADFNEPKHALCSTSQVDEIQTGFCRTGNLFAVEHGDTEVEADFMSMGKGMAGGVPMAALAVSHQIAQQIQTGDHGGTYCGNPLGCAVAGAVVEFLTTHSIGARVRTRGAELLQGLKTLQRRYPNLIREARGIGLLTALELHDDRNVPGLTLACQQLGLLVTPTRNGIIRFIPDLLVSSGHIDEALHILNRALLSFKPRVAAAS